MTSKELKKLGRADLLELLVAQSKEAEGLLQKLEESEAKLAEAEEKIAATEEKLRDRSIKVDQAGSIAEAALSLSGIFEAAEEAAAQYLENIETLSGRQEAVCARMETESRIRSEEILKKAREEAEAMLADARKESGAMLAASQKESQELIDRARKLEQDTRDRCEQMQTEEKRKADAYWNEVHQKIEQICRAHEELKGLFAPGGHNSSR